MGFNQFKNKAKKNKQAPQGQGGQGGQGGGQENTFVRARIPRGREVLGIIEQRVGANRMVVKCLDGKQRNCRIPGALRRSLWLRPGDTVIVEPWEFDADTRGDVIFKYTPAQIDLLKRKGFLKDVQGEF